MKFPHRRQFLDLAAGAAALPALSRAARAQAYPTRPITMVVPFPAGGPTDVIGRVLTERTRALLGQPAIVENVAGAAGNLGVGRVAPASQRSLSGRDMRRRFCRSSPETIWPLRPIHPRSEHQGGVRLGGDYNAATTKERTMKTFHYCSGSPSPALYKPRRHRRPSICHVARPWISPTPKFLRPHRRLPRRR
jgi:hypothetical protein